MYAVTAKGVELIETLGTVLDRGLISRAEWAREVHDAAQRTYALSKGACGMDGCNYPAMWRALTPDSTPALPKWVRMCAGCVEWHTDALCLEPISEDGVYSPDIGDAIDHCNGGMAGLWQVFRQGQPYDSMHGYGYGWAMSTLNWLCAKPEWVTHGEVRYTNPDTGYTSTVHTYWG